MGWPQQMSWPWPGLVTMNSEPHLVQKYRFPTWFAMVCHPRKVYRRAAHGVNIESSAGCDSQFENGTRERIACRIPSSEFQGLSSKSMAEMEMAVPASQT